MSCRPRTQSIGSGVRARVDTPLSGLNMVESPYNDAFYAEQVDGSLRSARAYLAHLFALWQPDSVIDVGCGRGAWLAACAERGVKRLTGLDGDWVSQEMMLDPTIEFRRANLSEEMPAGERYDLVISLEVAEHLPPGSSDGFVRMLVAHAGAVVFSAAYVSQPGRNHINTQPHSFWANKFLSHGYLLFDFFRPQFWSDNEVDPWYRQNTFLYVRPEHPLHAALTGAGHAPLQDARFVDCIHPWLYFGMLEQFAALQQRALLSQRSPAVSSPRVGRNDPCPCGSGKKYKHCHGTHVGA